MKAYLEIEEVQQLENAATCPRDKLLIRVLSRLGCRISEALGLQVRDIDFVRRTVTILHLKKRIRLSCPKCKASLGRRHQFCPECGDKVGEAMRRQQEQRHIRVLPVDKQTLDMLEDYIGCTHYQKITSQAFVQ